MNRWLNNNYKLSSLFDAGKSSSGLWWPLEPWFNTVFVTTGHRVDRVLSFFSSRQNWDSPTPSTAGECPSPPLWFGGGHTRLRERKWGSLPIPTKGHTRWYSICILCAVGAPVASVTGWKENNRTTCGLVVESADQMDHVGDWRSSLRFEGSPDVGKTSG
jgi:hypothetical protein